MAEFCKQCAFNLFGEDPGFNDAAGMISKEESDKGFAVTFLCEECGPTLIDHEGACITDCIEHHKPKA